MTKKFKIAVTGGIGGGKSSFCRYIESKGYTVFKADDISKDILLNDSSVKKKIIALFGEESYNNGQLNKKYLAEKVFSSEVNVKKINSAAHPAVIKKLEKLMKETLQEQKAVFVEAALIFEARMNEMFDYVVLVMADDEIKKRRLMEKGFDMEDYERRKLSQVPDDKKRKKADFTFENNGTEAELYSKADIFLKLLSL